MLVYHQKNIAGTKGAHTTYFALQPLLGTVVSKTSASALGISQVTETNLAQDITPIKPIIVLIDQVTESTSIQVLIPKKTGALQQVVETTIPQPLTPIKVIVGEIQQVQESGTSQSFSALKGIIVVLGQVVESSESQTTTPTGPIFITIGQVVETSIGQTIALPIVAVPRVSNLKIIHENLVDTSLSITATSEAVGHLITEVQSDFRLKTWRSTNLAAQTLTITWSTPQWLSGLGLPFNNLLAGSTVQVKAYTLVADPSPILDTGVITIDFSFDTPTGLISGNYFSTFFDRKNVEKVEVIINSPANPDGYMELSRIVIGDAWTPFAGVDRGVSVSYSDSYKGTRTDSGDEIGSIGTLTKAIKFGMGLMQIADKPTLHRIFKKVGKWSPIYVSLLPSTEDVEEETTYQIYGRINSVLSIDQVYHEIYKVSIGIGE